jgi:hypothetical protein
LFKHSQPKLPCGVDVGLDLGYQGVLEDFALFSCLLPFKRKSSGQGKRGVKAEALSEDQCLFIKFLSSAIVVVEHTNSCVKKFRVFGEEFRNRLRHYDIMTGMVCGIVNFRILGKLSI